MPSKKASSEAKTHKKSSHGSPAAKKGPTIVVNEKERKKQNFIIRALWTFVMIGGFLLILAAGHLWTIALVLVLQIMTFKEVINLASVKPTQMRNLPYTSMLNWYFLATTVFYLDGESFIYYFKHIILVDAFLLPFANHHRFVSYCLYVFGFIFFVFSLEKGYYKQQFTQFCVTHMCLLLVVFQAHLIINNILTGLFWFVLPAALVIVNDIFAYLCGITFGRTQLIAISPKKTREGFVGAWICTTIAAVLFTHGLIRYSYVICPVTDLGSNVFSGLVCEPNAVFLPAVYHVPEFIARHIGKDLISFPPIYIHAGVIGSFASLIAPFGGFFASGLKRAFNIKDFGDTIPGHGGITDRMDCQYLMGSFVYLYYQTFVATHHVTVGSVLQLAVMNLSHEEQLQLVSALHKYLYNAGLISDRVYRCLSA